MEDKETGTGVVQGLHLHGELTPLHDWTMSFNNALSAGSYCKLTSLNNREIYPSNPVWNMRYCWWPPLISWGFYGWFTGMPVAQSIQCQTEMWQGNHEMKSCGEKLPWPNLKLHPARGLEELRKTVRNPSTVFTPTDSRTNHTSNTRHKRHHSSQQYCSCN